MRSWNVLLPLMLVVAFLIRAVVALGVHHYVNEQLQRSFLIPGDANGYWELGQKLAAGEEFAIYDPPRRVMRMPGFPLFLAASIQFAGNNLLAARLLLAGVGTVAVWLVYILGVELFDRRTGLLAAALTSVAPTLVGFSVLILSETLFAALLVGSLVLMARIVNTRELASSPRRDVLLPLAAGVVIALACYVRPSWLLAGPLFVALLVGLSPREHRRERAGQGMFLLAGMLLALCPWIARNYLATGRVVVTTLWVGPSLYDGLNPDATGDSDMEFIERDALYSKMSEYDVDRYYRSQAWQFVRENPGHALQLAAVKLWRFFKPWPNAPQFDGLWQRVAVAAFFVPLLLLAACGGWRVRDQLWPWIFTIGPLIYFAGIHTVFVGSLRYRLPAEYPLCVISAIGLQFWRDRMKG